MLPQLDQALETRPEADSKTAWALVERSLEASPSEASPGGNFHHGKLQEDGDLPPDWTKYARGPQVLQASHPSSFRPWFA